MNMATDTTEDPSITEIGEAPKFEVRTFAIPTGRIEDRDPKGLDEHPLLRVVFPQNEPDEANEELGDSLLVRQYQPVLITGEGCVSHPGTVLDGRRRKLQALRRGHLLRVEVLNDLGVEMEEAIVIHSNIAAGLARRLTERQKADLEHRLILKYGKRQGERTDLTSPDSRGSETNERVAREMHETRNAVDDRRCGAERADHVERPLGEIDHVHDSENERQSRCKQEQHDAQLQRVEQLFEEQLHEVATSCTGWRTGRRSL